VRLGEALPRAVAPLLRACAVAVPQLDLGAVRGAAARDVDALAEYVDRAVAGRPRERLRGAAGAVPELDRRAVRGRAAGVVDALRAVADDRAGDLAAVARAHDRRRVGVVARAHVLREPQVLALRPHE